MFKFIWLIRDRNYWRTCAESFEKKLDSERVANRRYEREMVSRIVTMTGQMGIQQEALISKKAQSPPIPVQPTQEIVNSLTPQQQEDLTMYLEDAERNGKTQNEGWRDFYQNHILPQMEDMLVDVEN